MYHSVKYHVRFSELKSISWTLLSEKIILQGNSTFNKDEIQLMHQIICVKSNAQTKSASEELQASEITTVSYTNCKSEIYSSTIYNGNFANKEIIISKK